MAGIWEIPEQVLVAILTIETVPTAWAAGFRNLIIPGGNAYNFLSGMPFDHARNMGCQKLLETDIDWLFFLDDDVVPPADAILKLMSHRQPIVSGVYYRRNNPIVPVILKTSPDGKSRTWVTQYRVPDLMEVDCVGAGCLLIHRNVLLNLPYIIPGHKHWFAWQVDNENVSAADKASEDFSFCLHAKKHGYKILVDTSVQCRHIGRSETKLPGNIHPMEII